MNKDQKDNVNSMLQNQTELTKLIGLSLADKEQTFIMRVLSVEMLFFSSGGSTLNQQEAKSTIHLLNS